MARPARGELDSREKPINAQKTCSQWPMTTRGCVEGSWNYSSPRPPQPRSDRPPTVYGLPPHAASVSRGRCEACLRIVTRQAVAAGGDHSASCAGGAGGGGVCTMATARARLCIPLMAHRLRRLVAAVFVPPRMRWSFTMQRSCAAKGREGPRGVALPGAFVVLSPVCFPFRVFPFSKWRWGAALAAVPAR